MALFVAIVGVYGVTSVLVAARTREIGIRIALGAGRDRIRRLVVMPTARLLAVGVAAGGGGAILATRWIDSQLFGVQPSDPATYVMVAAVVTSAALAATWRPSRRATRIDPVLTLRAE
jgi:ABC-type antimicrobial peptide transport system permease subunit